MKPRGSTLVFLACATLFFGLAHYVAWVFFLNAKLGVEEVRFGSRPWYATTVIGAYELFSFPFVGLAQRGGDLEWLGPLTAPLNSALIGFVLAAVVLLVLRVRAKRISMAVTAAVLLLGVFIAPSFAAIPGDARTSTVGIPARITDLVLPGGELEVLPQDAKTAVVLRITRVEQHGTDHRYDIEWTGLDPGRHDLRAFLRRKDGTDASNLPEIAVDVRSVLAPGQVRPNHPPEHVAPRFGGYRGLMIGLGIAWALGLVAILFLFRKKRVEDHAKRARPRTLAERLRPLVERAMAGTLDRAERAQLELGLVAYWRRRLGLDAERPDEAIAALRRHAEAGPLLNALDAWLYKPAGGERVDLAALLAPYKDLPPDALDLAVEAR